jgi:hypothetical protein
MAKFTEEQLQLLKEFGEMAAEWADGGSSAALRTAEKEVGWAPGLKDGGAKWLKVLARVKEIRAPIDEALARVSAAIPMPKVRQSIWADGGSPEVVEVPLTVGRWFVYAAIYTEGYAEWPADWSKSASQIRREEEMAEQDRKAKVFGTPEFWAAQDQRLAAKELVRR